MKLGFVLRAMNMNVRNEVTDYCKKKKHDEEVYNLLKMVNSVR